MSETSDHEHGSHGQDVRAGNSVAGAPGVMTTDYDSYTREMHSSMQVMMEDMHRDPPSVTTTSNDAVVT